MKTNIFNTLATRIVIIVASLFLGLNFASCSNADADAINPDGNSELPTSATVTFTYSVPQELLQYAEITVCRNNNEGTDALWGPMLNPTHTVTYNITKFPMTVPVVMVYDFTNRPAGGHIVDWDIQMDVQVAMNIGGRTEIKTHHVVYKIQGDAARGLETLMKNTLDRTFGVKLSKTGNVQFVP